MTSHKLNQNIRKEIRRRALEDAFSARREELQGQEKQLVREVKMRLLPSKKMLDAWEALPEAYRNDVNVMGVAVNVGGQSIRLRPADDDSIPNRRLDLAPDDHLGKRISEFEQRQEALRDESRELANQVDALLHSVTTTGKLLEIWPEAEPYIPNMAEPSKALVSVSQVNSMIQSAKQKREAAHG